MIYLAPMKKWVVEELESREKNPNKSNTKMPFVIMSSGAKILKNTGQKTRQAVLEMVGQALTGTGSVEYQGCILSNHIDSNINYSNNSTIIGYDFTGKLVTAVGETGRKISPPIIESVDIETSGNSNALKEVKVNVRCFSLKQFEMFELFFAKPSMHILLEFGDNSNSSLLNSAMVSKNDYQTYINKFKEFTDPTTNQFAEYLEICRKSNGSYDRVAGKLIDYSYSIDKDSTYNVQLTIAQSNEYNLALPKAFEVNYSAVQTPNNKNLDTFNEWKSQIVNDLPGLDKAYIDTLTSNDWKNDFFNWGKSDELDIEKNASNEPYISLRFILNILMNNIVNRQKESNFTFEYGGRFTNSDKELIIPINVHKDIISTSPKVIFPNKNLLKFNFNTKSNVIEIDSKEKIDGTINGYTLYDNKTLYFTTPENIQEVIDQPIDKNLKIGNALNIFVRYKEIGIFWEKNYTRKGFLIDILEMINELSFGDFKLIYGSMIEGDKATVIDSRLYLDKLTKSVNKETPLRKPYRFKPTTINSNVREFDFNFELGAQVAAATIFNMNKFLVSRKYNTKEGPELGLLNEAYQSIDFSTFATADGLYSINQIEWDQLKSVTDNDPQPTITQEEKTSVIQRLKSAYNLKQVKFKLKKGDIKPFIYLDFPFIYNHIKGKIDKSLQKNTYELVTPITVTLKIDGISGITCGETFKVDGIPEQYNRLGDFMILNTKHNIDKDNGWTTTLEASFLYGS
jgi:hypothetical protein